MTHAQDLPDFDKLWDYQKPAETEKKFRALLPAAEAAGDRDILLQLRTQIARALGLQGKFEEAHALLDQVEKGLADGLDVARVRYLLERGRAFNSGGKPAKARPLFLEAWELGLAKKLDHYAVDAAHMMAIVEPVAARRAWNLKATDVAERSEDERAKRWLGTLYNNMGWDCHDEGDFEKALELHRKCLAWHEARDPASRGTRIARWSVGKQLRCLGRAEEALEIQRALERAYAEAGDPDGFVHEEIGECLLALGKAKEAQPHFAQAHALLAKIDWVEKERLARLERLAGGGG